MKELKQGHATVQLPDDLPLKDKAGKLSAKETAREIKSYQGLGLCCQATSQSLDANEDRIRVPGIDTAQLEQAGRHTETLAALIVDVEALLIILKQNQLLLSADAHRQLLTVLAFMRAHEKFDPRIGDLFPVLLAYFSKSRAQNTKSASGVASAPAEEAV